MALTTAQKETIIMKTASALFNKAFSQETSANFVTFYDNNENDLGKLSDAFIGSSVYEAQYANATTKADFGTILMAKYNMTYGGSSDADMKMTAFVDYSFAHAADSNSLRTIQAVDKFIVATLIPSMTVDNVFEKMHSAISNKAEVAIAFKNDASSVGQELSLVTITDDHITVDTAKVSINPTAATTGILLDGYISGGTVFADANGDGIWNAGEAKATTDANGNFTLIGAKGTIVGSGGTDFNRTLDPNPECPVCGGEGEGRVFIQDTRKLSSSARLAYSGTKVTQNGIEILSISREKMFELIMRRVGLADSETAQKLQKLEIERRQLEIEKLRREIDTEKEQPITRMEVVIVGENDTNDTDTTTG